MPGQATRIALLLRKRKRLERGRGRSQDRGVRPVVAEPAPPIEDEEAGLAQDLQVLRHARGSEVQEVDQLACGQWPVQAGGNQIATRLMGEGAQPRIKLGGQWAG